MAKGKVVAKPQKPENPVVAKAVEPKVAETRDAGADEKIKKLQDSVSKFYTKTEQRFSSLESVVESHSHTLGSTHRFVLLLKTAINIFAIFVILLVAVAVAYALLKFGLSDKGIVSLVFGAIVIGGLLGIIVGLTKAIKQYEQERTKTFNKN